MKNDSISCLNSLNVHTDVFFSQWRAAEQVLDVYKGGWWSESGRGAGADLSWLLFARDPKTHPEAPAGVWAHRAAEVSVALWETQKILLESNYNLVFFHLAGTSCLIWRFRPLTAIKSRDERRCAAWMDHSREMSMCSIFNVINNCWSHAQIWVFVQMESKSTLFPRGFWTGSSGQFLPLSTECSCIYSFTFK